MQAYARVGGCLLIAAGVAACSARSQDPPASQAPPSLDGTISEGRYVAPDGSFSVALPHASGSFEASNMQIRDGRDSDPDGNVTYVIFGPGPTDPAGYHVVLATPREAATPRSALERRADRIMSHYMGQYDATYRGQAERLVFTEAQATRYPAIYGVYRYEYEDAGAPQVFYVVFMISEFSPKKLVNVMAEKLTLANPWYPGVNTLMAGEWSRFNDFARSVAVAE